MSNLIDELNADAEKWRESLKPALDATPVKGWTRHMWPDGSITYAQLHELKPGVTEVV